MTEVFVNGRSAGKHIGGYTKFTFQIDSLLNFNDKLNNNEIVIKVDNSNNEDVPPLSADFTFFGGIYRDVNLVFTSPVHFSLTDLSSDGIYVSTPAVSKQLGTVRVKSVVVNQSRVVQTFILTSTIFEATGKEVTRLSTKVKLKSGVTTTVNHLLPAIVTPHLWSPENPYLYRVTTTIANLENSQPLDVMTAVLGFRWFKFDAEKGFFLNDKHYKLIGTSRHQDYPGLGNALPDTRHIEDVMLLKQMGGNFLRVAHYPQDASVLEMCDKLGILTSVEIPIVNAITESEGFTENSLYMQAEMIRQHYNHPSVVIWAYMNEILLRPKFSDDQTRQQEYYRSIAALAQKLEDVTRKEDPSRYTMIPNHGDFKRYNAVGLTKIPMLVGWNLYQGWYGGKFEDFAKFLDMHHAQLPNKPLLITEYGADADPRIHSDTPERFDKSAEYALMYHKVYLNAMQERPFVSAAMIWNLADFNSETREESMPHVNNKGIVTLDRKPKDIYYYYQANLIDKAFLKVGSSLWPMRTGVADDLGTCIQTMPVFTNLPSVSLLVNNVSLGSKSTTDRQVDWEIPFSNGVNIIEATGEKDGVVYRDKIQVDFKLQSADLRSAEIPFESINILLGARRYYYDESTQQIWQPDQAYRKNSWGYIGGSPYAIKNSWRQSYGTDKNILNTNDDPIYQTQHIGIEAYQLDLPEGEYELTLHFSELEGGEKKEALAYNLDNSERVELTPERIFDVLVNGQILFKNLTLSAQYGFTTAVAEKTKVLVSNNLGIRITFKPVKGLPVLNALQVRRMK
jgi:beta-galactosidase